MPIPINDPKILHKMIELQGCIIEGRSVKAILHKNIDYFLEQSGADMITIYMHEHGMVNPEYILEKEKLLTHLLKKYIFNKKNFKWETFVANCDKHFASGIDHEQITELYTLFRSFISKREATSFTEELQMKSAIMIPLYAFDDKEIIIGYTCFIFQSDNVHCMEQLQIIKTILETLLRPLYDKKINTLYTKCIRIDEEMNLLTNQEKKIVKQVLTGASYATIAKSLNISINTLKTHMKNIFNKSNVNSKIELFNKYYIHL
ncbi:MAG: helix-turn-helix transcriptional regulator [Campylobacterota bacterium]|nr:helix-turn-helix transcriptional regulator [Campylobacterota bacterium]